LLVALNYERWHGSNKETSLGQKSVPKREELETTTVVETREYGTYEDEDVLDVGRLSSIELVSVGVATYGGGYSHALTCMRLSCAQSGARSPDLGFLVQFNEFQGHEQP